MSKRSTLGLCCVALCAGLILGTGWVAWPWSTVHAQPGEPGNGKSGEDLAREARPLQQFSQVLSKIANVATPSVVHIQSERRSASKGRVEETGSGVIMTSQKRDGFYVVTNRHVIDGASLDDIAIQLSDGREIRPERVLSDPATDVAVLKISASNITANRWADSNQVDIGHLVLAMGSPFGLSRSVTLGIISAKGRRQLKLGASDVLNQDFLQTDAAINPGNSGGPLIDLSGRVVGINTAIASSSGGNEGIGFSIPSNLAQNVMEQLLEYGVVHRAYLGVKMDPAFDARMAAQLKLDRARGARITQVYPNTPAAKANLLVDDVVVSFDGVDVQDQNHLINLVSLTPIGKQIRLGVWRGGKRVTLTILLADRNELKETSEVPSEPGMGQPIRLMGLTVHPLDGDLAEQLGFTRSTKGLLILKVDSHSQLASDLQVYDVLEAVGRKTVATLQELQDALEASETNGSVLLRVQRASGAQVRPHLVVWNR